MWTQLEFRQEWRRPAAIVAGVAAFALLVAWLLQDDPILVDVHAVGRGNMQVSIDEEGITEIKDIYRVSAPIAGRVRRSPLKVGDPVRQGKTVVASLEPVIPSFLDRRTRRILDARAAAAEAAVALAEAAVARARADLEFRDKELGRAQELIARSTISQRQLDEAIMAQKISKAALSTAIAELGVRQREFDSARAQLIEPSASDQQELDSPAACCVEVYAPVSGRVTRIMTESETVVASGAELLELGNPTDLEVVVDLLSVDAVKVREGAKAVIEAWGGDDVLHGVVTRVEPTGFKKVSALGIEEQRVNVRLDLVEPFSKRLKLGHNYRVFVRIIVWAEDDVLSVPLSAAFRSGNEWAVFVDDRGTAQLRPVNIGRRNGRHVQIVDGLAVGEKVVLHPSDRVADGVAIRQRGD
jgi:HlyD family secretion protein